jgi:3-mercaptopyruvate sulfurtransferase SseA
MSRWAGFDNAALLDSGLNAWTEGDRILTTNPAKRPAKTLTAAVRPN